ncbi:MAG: GNAT family N-acetyltransferase [Methylococcales bacterium]|nr:GNAT family N-acetyltransferase [Methylococcales bacterium]
MKIRQLSSISDINVLDWNKLAGKSYPFLKHEFLHALEKSGAVSKKTGWLPAHLIILKANKMIAFMPLYIKNHSWGEYVFDHQWASAYYQNGFEYYPKYLTAIPFTPCQGPRIVVNDSYNAEEIYNLFLKTIQQLALEQNISSWHCLFPNQDQISRLNKLEVNIREGTQFQWFNQNYQDFDDFLSVLTSSKRKMIKRERKRIAEQGMTLIQLNGAEVTEAQWETFFNFYTMTYLKKGSEPYLTLEFFLDIARTMGEQLLLVFALNNQRPVAAALSFIGSDTLYGRYWGCYEEYHSLHFETCYYQGIDYCIQQQLKRFDSGAQGEHKIARGFEPVTTYSAHWIKDSGFADAIGRFLEREKIATQQYKANASAYLPFK